MENHNQWRLFNIDSLIQELKGEAPDGPTIDLYVASLAFKNFDFVAKRLPFVIESVTHEALIWRELVQIAPLNSGFVTPRKRCLCLCRPIIAAVCASFRARTVNCLKRNGCTRLDNTSHNSCTL